MPLYVFIGRAGDRGLDPRRQSARDQRGVHAVRRAHERAWSQPLGGVRRHALEAHGGIRRVGQNPGEIVVGQLSGASVE